MAISTKNARDMLKNTGDILKHAASDLLSNSDFISRTIGMTNSYEDITLLVQALGRQPVSLLGKDYLYIFDHVRRNYQQGTTISSIMYGSGNEYWCPKFTFYKERPTVKFADPYTDHVNLLGRWMPDFVPNDTIYSKTGYFYAESNDGVTNNMVINSAESNAGTASGQYSSSFQNLSTCDLIKKTNENFNSGAYNTLVARFHTNSDDSRRLNNPTQTAVTDKYGMSHGRNLLKVSPSRENGYNNPYCRVWTYHHQYHRMIDAIRPFGGGMIGTAEQLENAQSGEYGNVSFRTHGSKNYKIGSGSNRLDTHGTLNYNNNFVNIAPTAKLKDYFEGKEEKSVSTKRCMFSIENLAWRDDKAKKSEFEPYGLSPEQRGPLGGRIMWFPPYDIQFNESVSVKWNSNEFIGRGENIYTYTNTERRGNLSFTLVIDHPAILDYWTGHDAPRGDLKNNGRQLMPGNSGGVDEINNQEQTLLRFFAGCDMLTAKPQQYWSRDVKPEVKPDIQKDNVPQPNPPKPDEAEPAKKTIYCFVFYPNNYSGKDDGGIVNPIHYLLNGIGTQKRVNEITKNADDFMVDMNHKVFVYGKTGYGGYEMRENGISVAEKPLKANYETIRGTYADTQTTERKAQYLTDENGESEKINAYYDGGEPPFGSPTLAKQIGSTALSLGAAQGKNINSRPFEWYRKRWYYRVDNDTANQQLNGSSGTTWLIKENYLDTSSSQYNSVGIYNCKHISGQFKIDIDKNNDTIVSLADMYTALEGVKEPLKGTSENDKLYNEDKVNLIKQVKEGVSKGTHKITNITFYGHASTQGNNKSEKVNTIRNNSLAKNRALTLKKWMTSVGFPEAGNGKFEFHDTKNSTTGGVQKAGNKYDVNDPVTKFWRSAYVKIEYEVGTTENASNKDSAVQTDKNGNVVTDENGKILDQTNTVTKSSNKSKSKGSISAGRDWLENTEEGRKLMEKGTYMAVEYIMMKDGTPKKVLVPQIINPDSFTVEDAERNTGKNYTDTAATNYDDSFLKQGITVKTSTVKRYDNEGEFFQLLDKKSPFLHNLITDKIKYFDPAYHAISPEGFNARLTFLHQCTRQGATIGNSDPNVQTAYNLAFGRPPVCVLRIGDFYYTKIIINSLTINYDDPQWDLNPEGIGVMPMFAKINIDFNFIGGSDLAGPIARLQNAVSFNYYANTGVYDNRAERVEYNPNGTGKEIAYKPFNYPYNEDNEDA